MSWLLASLVVLVFALVTGFAWYERSHPSARVLALVAALAALAALGRIAFAPLPSIKPTTDIVFLTGFVLGGAPGFAVGAVGALASNLFFGQGPWTPWQMGAWGGVGVAGAALAHVTRRRYPELGRIPLAAACAAAGLFYGAIMDLSTWLTFSGDLTSAKLATQFAAGVPFNIAHATGNVLFCLAFGPALVGALRRYRTRFEVTWRPAAPAVAAAIALVAVLGPALMPPAPAGAAVPAKTIDYLRGAQNSDGGFAGAPGQASTQLHTGWAGLGLAAAGRNPLDVRKGGRSVLDYVAAHGRDLTDLGALERTIMLQAAAGRPPRVGSRDLVADLVAKRRANGSFAGRVNTTAFAILALRAAGRPTTDRNVRAAARWIARQANPDGGFNFGGRGGPSGVDDTGAALQGLVAAGRRGTTTVKRAASFLVRRQNADGGFPLQPGSASNAQSTAWAVQGLLAAGRDPAAVRRNGSRSPLAYLESLVGPDGSVRYSRTSRQTPVWVTAQAVMAMARKPFPFAAVRRAARRPARRSVAPKPTATPRPVKPHRRSRRAARPAKPEPSPDSVRPGAPSHADVSALAHDTGVLIAVAANAIW